MLDRTKFATLRRGRRVWAVAAIHGEAERLERVHGELERRFATGDRVVYLGNYLGYGGAIVATLDLLLAFRRALLARPGAMVCDVAFLRGAQEEMWHKLLQLQLALDPGEVLAWMLGHGVDATIAAYGADPETARSRARAGTVELTHWTQALRQTMQAHPGHDALLSSLRRAALTEDGALLFVHAGLDPTRPLEAQGDALWWGGGFDDIRAPPGGFRKVVRGYDQGHHGVQVTSSTASIDSGCGFGGPLNAACFDAEGRLVDLIEG